MNHVTRARKFAAAVAVGSTLVTTLTAQAAGEGWSIIPYVGISQLGNQSPNIAGGDDIVDGGLDIAVDSGFTAGLRVRYDYESSRWTSEVGWEYRTNDSETTTSDGNVLPDGNYASNTFYLNGRYSLTDANRWTPWIGGGLTWIQEVDLDSENADGERSFSDSGSIGFQVMAGVDYDLSDRFYLTSELRYGSQSALNLEEEGGNGRVTDIEYQPVTLGLGVGIRF